jgi:hypothetical protein
VPGAGFGPPAAGDQSVERFSRSRNPARRNQVVRVRCGVPTDSVAAGDEALHEESQFDLHRREDLFRSRFAGAHAALFAALQSGVRRRVP